MRNLFIIGMLLVAAFMAGWFQINREGDRTTIEINRAEIRSDTRQAIDRGRDFLDRRDQQYTESQQPLYDEQGRAYWPQEQIASQQDQWAPIQQQSYEQDAYQPQGYVDPNYDVRYQPLPNQSGQQNYAPVNR